MTLNHDVAYPFHPLFRSNATIMIRYSYQNVQFKIVHFRIESVGRHARDTVAITRSTDRDILIPLLRGPGLVKMNLYVVEDTMQR